MHSFRTGQSPVPRSLFHIAQPVFAGTCAIFTAISGGKKPKQQGRKEQSEGNRRKKEGQRRKRNQRSEKKQTEGKRNARTEAEKSNKTKEKKQERAKGNKTRIDKETSNKTKEKGTKNDKKQGKKVKTKEKGASEMKAEQEARKQEQKGTRRQRRHEVDRKRKPFVEAWKTALIECKVLKFSSFGRSPPSSVGSAQDLNLMVVGSSPTEGVAAEPTQSLSSVNLQTMHPLKNAGTADWSCLGGFSDPHQTRTNIWKRFLKIFSESGLAQWLACWAHSPKVPGSKPGSAMHALIEDWPAPCATQPIPHSPACLCWNLRHIYSYFRRKKAETTREEGAERGKQEKERRTEEKKEPKERKKTNGRKKERTDRGGKKQQNEGKKTKKRAKGNKTRIDKETSNKTKEKGTKNDKKQGKKVKTKEKGANEMKAEQKARKQGQKGTRRQRRHEVDRKRWQFVEAWKTTVIECKVLKFSSFGRSPPSSVGRAQGP